MGSETGGRPARWRGWVGAIALLLVVVDLARAPERQVTAKVLIAGIHLYRAAVSPGLTLAGVRCRFEPTCSYYAEGSIRRRGALVGSWRALARLARCGPWTPAGTVDPVVPARRNGGEPVAVTWFTAPGRPDLRHSTAIGPPSEA